jgi:Tfp pilus assembly protein PilN
VRDDDLVIATARTRFDHWLDALSALGAVERVESVPTALVRHITGVGSQEGGVLVLAGSSGGDVTLARLADGAVAALRKLPAGADEVAAAVAEMALPEGSCHLHPWDDGLARALRDATGRAPLTVPTPPDAPVTFAAARGALLGLTEGEQLTLVSPALERRLRAAGRRRAVLHVAGLVAAIAIVFGALDYRRAATLRSLEEAIASAETAAAPVMELNREATAISEELALLADEVAARSNPLDVLLDITRLLPGDVYLTQLSHAGAEWELNGRAEDAARLIPLLEQSPRFDDVRFRTATTRVRVGGSTLESFSLVLRHVPTS